MERYDAAIHNREFSELSHPELVRHVVELGLSTKHAASTHSAYDLQETLHYYYDLGVKGNRRKIVINFSSLKKKELIRIAELVQTASEGASGAPPLPGAKVQTFVDWLNGEIPLKHLDDIADVLAEENDDIGDLLKQELVGPQAQTNEAGEITGSDPKTTGSGKAPGARKRGARRKFPDDHIVVLCVTENPKRKGSKSFDRFEGYFGRTDLTVKATVERGPHAGDLDWDSDKGFIKILSPEEYEKENA